MSDAVQDSYKITCMKTDPTTGGRYAATVGANNPNLVLGGKTGVELNGDTEPAYPYSSKRDSTKNTLDYVGVVVPEFSDVWIVTKTTTGKTWDKSFLDFDALVSLNSNAKTTVSTQILEEGGFSTYNKVKSPRVYDIVVAKGGTDNQVYYNAFNVLVQLEKLRCSTQKFALVTPMEVIDNLVLESYSYKNDAEEGAGMLLVNMHCVETMYVGGKSYTDKSPASPIEKAKESSDVSTEQVGEKTLSTADKTVEKAVQATTATATTLGDNIVGTIRTKTESFVSKTAKTLKTVTNIAGNVMQIVGQFGGSVTPINEVLAKIQSGTNLIGAITTGTNMLATLDTSQSTLNTIATAIGATSNIANAAAQCGLLTGCDTSGITKITNTLNDVFKTAGIAQQIAQDVKNLASDFGYATNAEFADATSRYWASSPVILGIETRKCAEATSQECVEAVNPSIETLNHISASYTLDLKTYNSEIEHLNELLEE